MVMVRTRVRVTVRVRVRGLAQVIQSERGDFLTPKS